MTRWVRFEWPEPLAAEAEQIAGECGFAIRSEGRQWELSTVEQVEKRAPRLLQVQYVAAPAAPQHELAFLQGWHGQDTEGPPDPAVIEEIGRLLEGTAELNQFLAASRLILLCAPVEDLPTLVETNLLASLGNAFDEPRVVFINFDSTVHGRTAFVRSMFTAEHAPEWLTWEDNRGFGALRGFAGGVLQGDTTILDPLLAATSPWMFGTTLSRVGSGLAAALFGEQVPWRRDFRDPDLAEMLMTSLLVDDPIIRMPPAPTFGITEAVAATRWGIAQADELIGLITDPTLFADGGIYNSRRHSGALANLERLFASALGALTTTGVDEYSRRLHLFEVLDVLSKASA